ncbi:MAG: alkaline phosphatase family protein [Pseudomonadota bacterium]
MTGLRENMARLAASYDGDSILNLVASIERSCGGTSAFAKASLLDEVELSNSQHLVLFVLDGMGDQLLHRYGHPTGLFCSHRLGTLSSVFPTTTSAAISTLLTGHPPAQHGILAWHMHLPTGVYTTLLAKYREDQQHASPNEHTLFRATPLFSRLTRDCYQVQPRYLVDSPFSLRHRGNARARSANNFNELLGQVAHISDSPRSTFTYVYWPELDALGHKHGVASPHWRAALQQIERGIAQLLTRLQGRGVRLLITADHGMVDAFGGHCESVDDTLDLKACLDAPIAGEPRAAFCRVAPDQLDTFDALCADRYADRLIAVPTDVAFDTGLFGPANDCAQRDRAGNRILLMRDKRTLVEVLPNEQLPAMVGVHGGLHRDEIDVPLISIEVP